MYSRLAASKDKVFTVLAMVSHEDRSERESRKHQTSGSSQRRLLVRPTTLLGGGGGGA